MKFTNAITIILFASIWGLLEATLGGVLHLTKIPLTGTIMASFGFAILYAALGNGVRPSQLALVGLIAASFKFIDSPLFGLAPFYITIVNPAVAIATQGLACAIVFSLKPASDKIMSLAAQFVLSSAISIVAFNAISVGVFGWATSHTENLLGTVFIQLPLMAILATFLSLGWAFLSKYSQIKISPLWKTAVATACVLLIVLAKIAL